MKEGENPHKSYRKIRGNLENSWERSIWEKRGKVVGEGNLKKNGRNVDVPEKEEREEGSTGSAKNHVGVKGTKEERRS